MTYCLRSQGFRRLTSTLAISALLAACSSPVVPDGGADVTMVDVAIDLVAVADGARDATAMDTTVRDSNVLADAAADRSVDAVADIPATDVARSDVRTSDVPSTDSPTDTPRADVMSSAAITIRDLGIYANCMPSVPPDPIIAFWTTDVRGATSATASLTSAVLTIVGSGTVTQTLTVDVPAVVLSAGSGTQDQRKTGADMNPTAACGELCSGATATLVLRFAVDGTEIEVRDTTPFGCVH